MCFLAGRERPTPHAMTTCRTLIGADSFQQGVQPEAAPILIPPLPPQLVRCDAQDFEVTPFDLDPSAGDLTVGANESKGLGNGSSKSALRSVVPPLIVNVKKVHTFRFGLVTTAAATFTDTDLLHICAIGAPTIALPNQLVPMFASVRLMRARLYNLPDISLGPTTATINWSQTAGVDLPTEYKSTVDYQSTASVVDLVPPRQSNVGFWLNNATIGGNALFVVVNPGQANYLDVTLEVETGDISHNHVAFQSSATATAVGAVYGPSKAGQFAPIGFTPYIV